MEVDPETRTSSGAPDDSAPAIRDAEAIGRRVAADEAAADLERMRLTGEPLRPIEPEPEAASPLDAGEVVLSVAAATLLADASPRGEPILRGSRGRIVLTNRRVIHVSVGGDVRSVAVLDVAEVDVVGDRQLLVALADGGELRFDMEAPRVFRVRIAHVVANERTARAR